jgi:hypothetical protein
MYASKQQLRAWVTELKRTGVMPEAFALVLLEMARGIVGKYRFVVDAEEAGQQFVVLILTKYHNIKVTRNIFGYLTSLCFNMLRSMCRDDKRYEELKRKADAHYREADNW